MAILGYRLKRRDFVADFSKKICAGEPPINTQLNHQLHPDNYHNYPANFPGFWGCLAPHLVEKKSIIGGSKSLPQYHRVDNPQPIKRIQLINPSNESKLDLLENYVFFFQETSQLRSRILPRQRNSPGT